MAPRKQSEPKTFPAIFRNFIRNRALAAIASKHKSLGMAEAKKEILSKLDISPSALEAMLYRGSGGMDTWIELAAVLLEWDVNNFDLGLTEVQEVLKKKRKISKGEAAWIKLGDSLSEDKKLFWSDLITLMDDVENGPYTIQRKK